ncbi:MAG TPA: hypothetical protein EYQ63_06340 [Fuerstia sp.]|nr:hypothetical protein [Fuerstiella sp.]
MVVDVTDLLPTFCELAGAPIPLGIDGVSIAPTLLGSGHQRRREFIIHEAGNGQSIIRGKHKLIRSKNPPLKLYDLEADHAETNDIAADHPQLVKELESLLLGERVAEPKGFANTYHHWTGQDSVKTSEPENWSEYEYANAGITYTTADGAPQLSWTARIENKGDEFSAAYADADLNVLALEVRGNVSSNASQSLVLGPGINLTGRNEIRLASHATLTISNGTVSSLRWVDIHPDATLNGRGSIDAIVYNKGTVNVTGANQPTLSVNGDYHQSADASLSITLADNRTPAFQVTGKASLGGTLHVDIADGYKPMRGKPYTVLMANQVFGTFANPRNEIVTSDGSRFTIAYSNSAVTLTAR